MVPQLRLGLAAMSACTYCTGTVFSLLAATVLVVLVALLWPVIYPTTEPLEIFAGTDRLGDRELPVRRQGREGRVWGTRWKERKGKPWC